MIKTASEFKLQELTKSLLGVIMGMDELIETVMEEENAELADQLTYIFASIGKEHLSTLVKEPEPPKFFFWLLDFISIPYCNSILYQAKFWKKFWKHLGEVNREDLESFGPLVERFLEQTFNFLKAKEGIFLDHNEKKENEKDFDEFYDNRRVFGEAI